ncbi:MAG: hypothetical protein PHV34_15330 [Verrucomicrobiae bacterium]|nr:hypothetical protein [Verrucomicrobiae bacterium]
MSRLVAMVLALMSCGGFAVFLEAASVSGDGCRISWKKNPRISEPLLRITNESGEGPKGGGCMKVETSAKRNSFTLLQHEFPNGADLSNMKHLTLRFRGTASGIGYLLLIDCRGKDAENYLAYQWKDDSSEWRRLVFLLKEPDRKAGDAALTHGIRLRLLSEQKERAETFRVGEASFAGELEPDDEIDTVLLPEPAIFFGRMRELIKDGGIVVAALEDSVSEGVKEGWMKALALLSKDIEEEAGLDARLLKAAIPLDFLAGHRERKRDEFQRRFDEVGDGIRRRIKEKGRLMANSGNPREFEVKRLAKAPMLDGAESDDAWRDASRLEGFLLNTTGAPPREKTIVHAGYDDNALHLAFTCHQERMGETKMDEKGGIDGSDCVHVFIVPEVGAPCYRFVVGASGKCRAERNGIPQGNADWNAQVSRGKNGWSAEMSIPFSMFDPKPGRGMEWCVNFCRNNKTIPELSSWTPTFQWLSCPWKFGRMLGLSPDLGSRFGHWSNSRIACLENAFSELKRRMGTASSSADVEELDRGLEALKSAASQGRQSQKRWENITASILTWEDKFIACWLSQTPEPRQVQAGDLITDGWRAGWSSIRLGSLGWTGCPLGRMSLFLGPWVGEREWVWRRFFFGQERRWRPN